VCWLQQISTRCWKCVFCSEFVIRCWKCVSCNELAFAAESVLVAVNQCLLLKVFVLQWICDLLPKVCWLQWISICCWKCVGCIESVFAFEKVLYAADLWFAVEIVLSAVNHRFAVEIVLSTTKLWFTTKIELFSAN
jgi:hypothetical protein